MDTLPFEVQGDLPRGTSTGQAHRAARLITRFGQPVAEVVPPPPTSARAGLARRHGGPRRGLPATRGARGGARVWEALRPLRLLLDTHIWLWSLRRACQSSAGVSSRAGITRPGNELWLSPISVWELLVLVGTRRILKLDDRAPPVGQPKPSPALPPRRPSLPSRSRFEAARSCWRTPTRPTDFLVATAMSMDLTLVTADDSLIRQNVCPVLPCR